LVRSLLNGAVFALLTRWFLRRRERWLRTNIYVFACATCVLTLKYSVFYQIVPFTRLIVPVLLITAAADWGFRKWNRVVDGAVTP
jgi:predicted membrane channel-forming protein YqfA (hemolysin III family)